MHKYAPSRTLKCTWIGTDPEWLHKHACPRWCKCQRLQGKAGALFLHIIFETLQWCIKSASTPESASADTDAPSAAFALCSTLELQDELDRPQLWLPHTHTPVFFADFLRKTASPAVCNQRKQVRLQRSLIETTTVQHDWAKFDSFGVLWW